MRRIRLAAALVTAVMLDAGCERPPRVLAPVAVWGEAGSHEGQFNQPRAVGFGRDGSVYVLDRSDRVQHFDAAGRFQELWHTPSVAKGNPRGITVTPDGHVYVADTHNSQILLYDPHGRLLDRWGRFGKRPGEFIWVTGVAVDGKGNLYTCEYGEYSDRVQKLDSHGRPLWQRGTLGDAPGQFQRPQGIALDSHDFVYVADAVNHRVQKLSPQGDVIQIWGRVGSAPGELRYPYDIAVDRHDRVYVCEYGNSRVSVFDTEGRFLTSLGRPGRGPGELNSPWGVGVDATGSIYVADTRNYRIQKFPPLPAPRPGGEVVRWWGGAGRLVTTSPPHHDTTAPPRGLVR